MGPLRKKVLICGFVEPTTLCSTTLYMSNVLPLDGFHPNVPICHATSENMSGGKFLIRL
jgi:hypothetical protein